MEQLLGSGGTNRGMQHFCLETGQLVSLAILASRL